ncbi:hypothetical protein BDV96DRAFT_599480 [Lophiotrema nucula]|uniref:Rhodopsin domain-containing protein n=1 Tax=Lophiotrema nucula TaxID=690887 RepID=A0A6A5Z916_9PLEO|nr:hypothetical protein BDV96DRAFT_599480 [Lophiotrema nucula]
MSSFEAIMMEMMKNPPDPNASPPLSNRKETIYGATVPFHIIAWCAVLSRLYTRFRIVRQPGWDDYIIILAAIFNLISMITLLGGTYYGIGKHLLYISASDIVTTMKWLYVQNASYYTTTALIKMSLLCQYLRIFRGGFLRAVTLCLLVLVTLWGFAYSFMAWFPCFPVAGFWDRTNHPNAKCYGFGFGDINGAMAAFVSFAATNMFFDTAIFLVPMAEYLKPGLRRKEVLALSGLFILGSIVVLMSILRLWTAVKHRGNLAESLDFTWWYPLTLIISCIEVDFAIMCASMPIFWPLITSSWNEIFVTREVHVTHHYRLDDSSDGVNGGYEMDGRNSLKSCTSQEGLTRTKTLRVKTDYADQYVVDHVTGKVPSSAEVEVETKSQKKSWI